MAENIEKLRAQKNAILAKELARTRSAFWAEVWPDIKQTIDREGPWDNTIAAIERLRLLNGTYGVKPCLPREQK